MTGTRAEGLKKSKRRERRGKVRVGTPHPLKFALSLSVSLFKLQTANHHNLPTFLVCRPVDVNLFAASSLDKQSTMDVSDTNTLCTGSHCSSSDPNPRHVDRFRTVTLQSTFQPPLESRVPPSPKRLRNPRKHPLTTTAWML